MGIPVSFNDGIHGKIYRSTGVDIRTYNQTSNELWWRISEVFDNLETMVIEPIRDSVARIIISRKEE